MSTDVQLYPDERNKIVSAWAAIQARYGGLEATSDNLVRMANETEQRMKELGFRVIVDISNMEVADDGELYHSPVIQIEGRIENETYGHDHERHAFEVQRGYEDGVEGAIKATAKLDSLVKKGK